MLALFAEPDLSLNAFLQYGSFGLVAFLVFWAITRFFPHALQMHREVIENIAEQNKAAITALVESFEKETSQCRQERLEAVKLWGEEREKDRASRHDAMNVLQTVIARLESKK